MFVDTGDAILSAPLGAVYGVAPLERDYLAACCYKHFAPNGAAMI